MIDQYDNEEVYCRKLGHHLKFSYCRRERENLPCAGIRNCWFRRIPLDEFLSENYTEEELEMMERPVKSKMETIYDIITRAKGNSDK